MSNTKVLFVERPNNVIEPSKVFKIVNEPIPQINDGQILIRNIYLSLDPAMRGWMNEQKSYTAPLQIGEVMRGATVGEVVASKNLKFEVGDHVSLAGGWQQFTVSDGSQVHKISRKFPLSVWLGVLGTTGATAYFGLLDVGKPKPGETILISGAAGATGSVVGQIGKIKGCRVVGIAGSDEKCQWLVNELGFDAAINYNSPTPLVSLLSKHCPKGIDIYFDNVGGAILDEALRKINLGARVVICGAISQYNTGAQPIGPKNYLSLLVNRARMEGFLVLDYAHRFQEAFKEMGGWLQQGKLKYVEHIVEGLENAPEAINLLFTGRNNGKLIVKIANETPTAKL